MLSELGILLGLIIIMLIAYKRVNMLIASLAASVVVCFLNGMGILDSLNGTWAAGFAGFVQSNYLTFALCALLGKVMGDTGCANTIAKKIYKWLGPKFSVYGCMVAGCILVYGGVSAFVAVFTLYPIFLAVFQSSNLPRRYIPAAIYASIATFVTVMIPGGISVINIMASDYFGTSLACAPVVGLVAAAVCATLQVLYLELQFRKARKAGEGFIVTDDVRAEIEAYEKSEEGNFILAILPLIISLVCLNVFKWNVIISIPLGVIAALALNWSKVENKLATINTGIADAAGPLINTSAAVAFGSVVKATVGFQSISALMDKVPGSPLFAYGIAVQILCGVCGSGSGGVGIALSTVAPKFLEMGFDPAILHRLAVIASTGLDTLPHCGLVVTVITYCKSNHKEAYSGIFMVSVVATTVAWIVATILGAVMYPI